MIQSSDIKKMVRNVLRRDKGLQDSRIMHPTREWFIGLVVLCVIVVVGGGYSALSYVNFDTKEYSDADASQGLITYRAAQVEQAIAKYSNKKNEHEQLIGDIPAVIPEPEPATVASSTSDGTSSEVPAEEPLSPEIIVPEEVVPTL